MLIIGIKAWTLENVNLICLGEPDKPMQIFLKVYSIEYCERVWGWVIKENVDISWRKYSKVLKMSENTALSFPILHNHRVS